MNSIARASTWIGRRPHRTPTYLAWRNMKVRCCDQKDPSWPIYGGRGVTICDRWLKSFKAFVEDMGERPADKHSLDRIDNNGNYEPGNCRWATWAEQAANRRTNIFIIVDGVRHTTSQAASQLGMTRGGILRRLERGWSMGDTVSAGKYERRG